MAVNMYDSFNILLSNTDKLIDTINADIVTPLESLQELRPYEQLQNVPDVYSALQEVMKYIDKVTRILSLIDVNISAFRTLKFSKNAIALITDYMKTDGKSLIERKMDELILNKEMMLKERDALDKRYKIYMSLLFSASRNFGDTSL